jgi:Cut8, nuclear proteasome tether protein
VCEIIPINLPPSLMENICVATLPPQSLLPILTSLISAQPSLKHAVLELIPRPTVDTAVQAIAQSAKKLRDAYPYSNSSSFASSSITSFGFGSTSTSHRSSGFGYGRSGSHQLLFGHTNANSSQHGGMREEYIVSRLRPHISDFVSACFSYLPYFSYVSPQRLASASQKSHPSETFNFLSALTSHILSQPPLTQASLVPSVLPRLQEEWKAWVRELDDIVNRQAGMFGIETVKGWEKELDEFAHAKGHGLEVLREVRDTWVSKVGWLVGRRIEYSMEEEEL